MIFFFQIYFNIFFEKFEKLFRWNIFNFFRYFKLFWGNFFNFSDILNFFQAFSTFWDVFKFFETISTFLWYFKLFWDIQTRCSIFQIFSNFWKFQKKILFFQSLEIYQRQNFNKRAVRLEYNRRRKYLLDGWGVGGHNLWDAWDVSRDFFLQSRCRLPI